MANNSALVNTSVTSSVDAKEKNLEKAQVYEFIHYVLALALQLMRV